MVCNALIFDWLTLSPFPGPRQIRAQRRGCRKRSLVWWELRDKHLELWWLKLEWLEQMIPQKTVKYTRCWPHPSSSGQGRWLDVQQPGDDLHRRGCDRKAVCLRWHWKSTDPLSLAMAHKSRRRNSRHHTQRCQLSPWQPCDRWKCQCDFLLLQWEPNAVSAIVADPDRGQKCWEGGGWGCWCRRRWWNNSSILKDIHSPSLLKLCSLLCLQTGLQSSVTSSLYIYTSMCIYINTCSWGHEYVCCIKKDCRICSMQMSTYSSSSFAYCL